MNRYLLLTKKQLSDSLPQSFKRGRQKRGLASAITSSLLMLLLVGCITAAFVIIFGRFAETYVGIKINRVQDVASRQYELMTLSYFALIIISIFTSTAGLNRALFESGDLDALITMPFSANELFASKLTSVYLKQTAISLFFVLTINFTFFVKTGTLGVYGALMSFVVALLLPIVPLAVASLIVLPFYYVKRTVSSHYVLYFVLITLIVALFSVGYSYVFNVADSLINTGKITSLFNEKVMQGIIGFSKYAYPASLISNLLLGREIGKNIGILIAISVGVAIGGILVIRAIFTRLLQARISVPVPHAHIKKLRFAKHSASSGLLFKEFLSVLRTPGYTYMYFTTAVVMPIMVFYSARMSIGLIDNLVGGLGSNFEVCTFIVLLYGTLTNTFCSTNVSRDGNNAITMKTLPYSPTAILTSKIVFCALVSFVSVFITCLVLAVTKLERPVDALLTLVSAIMIAGAQIVFATRLDLNHPHFSHAEDGEIKEANSTVSTVIFVGLLTSFVMGAALLFNTVKSLVKGTPITVTTSGISYVFALAIPFVLLAAALTFFFVGLRRAYENLNSEA